jgi:hypothetical protein
MRSANAEAKVPEQIAIIPTARWNIAECAAWIETKDLAEVGRAHKMVPARQTIKEIEIAWRSGEISPSGEIDGAPRRVLTADDANDYSIDLYDREGYELLGATVFRTSSLHHVFPHSYQPGQLLAADEFLIVVRSLRAYPEELVLDRYGAVELARVTNARMRWRFILGLSFDRNEVIEKWPVHHDSGEAQAAPAAANDPAKKGLGRRSGYDFDPYRSAAEQFIKGEAPAWTIASKPAPRGLKEKITKQVACWWWDANKPKGYPGWKSCPQRVITAARRWVTEEFSRPKHLI